MRQLEEPKRSLSTSHHQVIIQKQNAILKELRLNSILYSLLFRTSVFEKQFFWKCQAVLCNSNAPEHYAIWCPFMSCVLHSIQAFLLIFMELHHRLVRLTTLMFGKGTVIIAKVKQLATYNISQKNMFY